jgi:eukaryotic-like serine/threonine-protein kinase
MTLQQGLLLHSRYRVVKLLGQGGFGAVYRAWDTTFNLPCALKENTEQTPEAQRQFEREARMLRTLKHPNLPLVTDYFIIHGQGQYLVMDYVDGQDLEEILQQSGAPLAEAEVVSWMIQICDALTYLHNQEPPIIHRDIKPGNIRVTPQGQAMLVDFGIAKLYDPRSKTTQGARAVTPGFSPQEQYGKATTDARTDIYALGATMYTLLTAMEPPESIQRNLGAGLVGPSALNPAVSLTVEQVILKAMEMLPEKRFQTTAAMKTALLKIMPQGFSAGPVSLPAASPEETAPPRAHSSPQALQWPAASKPQPPVASPSARSSQPVIPSRSQVTGTWLGWLLVGIVLLVGFAAIGAMLANYFASRRDISPWSGFTEDTPTPTASAPAVLAPDSEPSITPSATRPPASLTPTVKLTSTVTIGAPRVDNFYACLEPCEADGSNAFSLFPEKTTRVFLRWEFENIPVGALYVRRWTSKDQEWVRYECTWPGPRDGLVEISLLEPLGLRSGAWTVTISLDGVDLLSETIDIEGSWDYWNPPGAFNTCYGQ